VNLNEVLEIAVKGEYTPMMAQGIESSLAFWAGDDLGKKTLTETRKIPPLDLSDIIRLNGGRIQYISPTDFCKLGERGRVLLTNSIYVHGEQDFDIILPTDAPLVEQRFTIAHELGHYALHSKTGKCFAKRKGNGQIEMEANCFALGFLMPSDEFKAAYEQYKGNMYRLATLFLVPLHIAESRITSLGLNQ
jgi:hypothetical protein